MFIECLELGVCLYIGINYSKGGVLELGGWSV